MEYHLSDHPGADATRSLFREREWYVVMASFLTICADRPTDSHPGTDVVISVPNHRRIQADRLESDNDSASGSRISSRQPKDVRHEYMVPGAETKAGLTYEQSAVDFMDVRFEQQHLQPPHGSPASQGQHTIPETFSIAPSWPIWPNQNWQA